LLKGERPTRIPLSAVRQLGVAGYVFSVIGGFVQRKLGHIVGTSPGVDMKTAILSGNNAGARVVLIDRDVAVTLRRFSQSFSFREKMRFLGDIIFPWRVSRHKVKINLQSVPKEEMVVEVLSIFRKRYPGLYKALISERNKFMVDRIMRVASTFPGCKIAVFVGAGHVEGMKKLLKKKEAIELVR
jgi:pheromone shutdown protein TraB